MCSRRFVSLSVGVCLILLGCSGPPPTPSAEQYFRDAKNNLSAAEFDLALKNLDRCVKSGEGNPTGPQCAVIRAALLVGLAQGARAMADAYTRGRQEPAARARLSDFTRIRADYYGMARVRFMSAMEATMAERGKLGATPVSLQMKFPEFTGTENPAVPRIRSGQWMGDAERYTAEKEAVRNAFARTLAAFAGAGDNVHKAHASFESGAVEIDPRVYSVEINNAFLDLSEIFSLRALDDARYQRTSLEVVRDNLDVLLKLLADKPDKDLEARAKKMKADCEKRLKALGA